MYIPPFYIENPTPLHARQGLYGFLSPKYTIKDMYFTLLGLIPVSFLFVAGAYRLWFHPLAAYPGPFWARLTNLYAAYHAWKGDLHVDMWRCHQLYGDYIRYGPDRLIFNTAESLQGQCLTALSILLLTP